MSNKVTVLDVDQNEILREVDVPNAICDLEFSADGKHLVLAGDGGMFLVDTETWVSVPMHLMVDSFSRAPLVLLSDKGYMGLDVTGHRPGFAIPEVNATSGHTADTRLPEPDNAVPTANPPEPLDQVQEGSF